ANRHQPVVVLGTMLFEVMAEVEKRPRQRAPFTKKEGNQQTTDAPITVEKGMDRLKLRMCQPTMDQQRKRSLVVKELLEVVQGLMHLMYRRGHERGVRERASSRSDPVLAGAKLT